ncbi:acid type B receptor subunit 2 [Seminavis robusta]|uniref:Acid type B receptor subunit 2 n=1 Tax=Seminavis robusta TaxID=568900 RepID=A0A9N8HIN1_9STRA|nr:acid type B receptor subunit 2 [Seminavis robusta]|eukprot:Sro510_g157210.1 acid type B receptor subunit 2 (1109) ;mRNA; f:17761-21427
MRTLRRGARCGWSLWLLFLLLLLQVCCGSGQQAVRPLDCDPCIERPSYTIQAIVHGTQNSQFWLQVKAAAVQAAKDLRVELIFDLYEDFDPQRMAEDIVRVATSSDSDSTTTVTNKKPDALLVTVPSVVVHDAIRTALAHMPVFGINSGYESARELGLLGFIAMNEYLGGQLAAEEFLMRQRQPADISKALFVNTEKGNRALDQRFEGFRDTLLQRQSSTSSTSSGNNTSDSTTTTTTTIQVSEISLSELEYDGNASKILRQAFEGCPYNVVLLSSSSALETATRALYANSCNLESTRLATFDVSIENYYAIAIGKLSFTISQQHYLQGSLGVWMATLYATQHKRLEPPFQSEYGVHFSGPKVINLEGLPSDTRQICEADAFPVCPNKYQPNGVTESRCPCTDRSRIRIGGVIHGTQRDKWADQPRAAAEQAAKDLGVQVDFKLLSPESGSLPTSKMAARIRALCRQGVDGLFVSIPNGDEIVPALQECLDLEVPIVSINVGSYTSANLGLLHHVGQLEYVAGYGGGKRLIDAGMKQGLCPIHEIDNVSLRRRCEGFGAAIAESADQGVTYLGAVPVERDRKALNLQEIRAAVGHGGDWEGLGVLALGDAVVEEAIQIKSEHPQALVGTFDINGKVFDGIEQGDLLFGIDQDLPLQGALPVWLLTLYATTGQKLVNFNMETGPRFLEEAPPSETIQCVETVFKVCAPPNQNDMNQLASVRPFGFTIAGISFATSLFFVGWVFRHRHHPRLQSSQPFFLVVICFGTIVLTSSIIPMSLDDSILDEEGCNKACMSVPWLASTGFTVIFAALFAKLWRITVLVESARKFRKRGEISVWRSMKAASLLLLVNVVCLFVWTVVDPMQWIRVPICGSGDESSHGYCNIGNTNVSVAMGILVLLVNMAVAILTAVQAYRARWIKLQFSETRYIFIMMLGAVQIFAVGCPLVAVAYTHPVASYFVKTVLVFTLSMTVLMFMFIPKMFSVHNMADDLFIRSSTSNPMGASGSRRGGEFEKSMWITRLRALEAVVLHEQGLELEPFMERAGIFLPNEDVSLSASKRHLAVNDGEGNDGDLSSRRADEEQKKAPEGRRESEEKREEGDIDEEESEVKDC